MITKLVCFDAIDFVESFFRWHWFYLCPLGAGKYQSTRGRLRVLLFSGVCVFMPRRLVKICWKLLCWGSFVQSTPGNRKSKKQQVIYLVHILHALLGVVVRRPKVWELVAPRVFVVLAAGEHGDVMVTLGAAHGSHQNSGVALIRQHEHPARLAIRQVRQQLFHTVTFLLAGL